jgi:hypothetical protein
MGTRLAAYPYNTHLVIFLRFILCASNGSMLVGFGLNAKQRTIARIRIDSRCFAQIRVLTYANGADPLNTDTRDETSDQSKEKAVG